MNITVYLGANEGNNPSLKRAVKELGTWIGKSGNALIYPWLVSALHRERRIQPILSVRLKLCLF